MALEHRQVCWCGLAAAVLLASIGGSKAASPTGTGTDGSAVIVDEPQGVRTNHGGGLWRYRRDPQLIGEFHAYVEARGLAPGDLLTAEQLKPPATMAQVLIEPEKLANLPCGAWSVQHWPGASGGGGLGAGEGGRGAYVPLRLMLPRDATYRLWVRYHTFAGRAAPIGIRIYPTGREEPLPILDVFANEWAGESPGWQWSSYLVDLPAEPVRLEIVHANPEFELRSEGRAERRLDCIYLTTECWRAEPPSLDELASTWQVGGPSSWPRADLEAMDYHDRDQTTRTAHEFASNADQAVRQTQAPFGDDEQDRRNWQGWMARPADWSLCQRYPKLFEQSLRFWRQKVGQLAQVEHGEFLMQGHRALDPEPGYRHLSRRIIFDDRWNLIGNPVMIAQAIRRFKSAPPEEGGSDHIYHWLEAERFGQETQGWRRADRGGASGQCLRPAGDETEATASQHVRLDRAGRYAVWLRSGILGRSYSPLHVRVTTDGVPRAETQLLGSNYPPDRGADWSWHKIGVVDAKAGGILQVQVMSIPRSQLESKLEPGAAGPKVSRDRLYRWIEAEEMAMVAFDWGATSRTGNSGDKCLGMGVDATGGAAYAAQEVPVAKPGEYYLWVRKGIQGKTRSPLRVIMLGPDFGPAERRTAHKQWSRRWLIADPRYPEWNRMHSVPPRPPEIAAGTMILADLDGNDYPPDVPGQWTWQRIGPLKVNRAGNVRVELHRLHYPYIYEMRLLTSQVRREMGGHYVDCVLLTNDADYKPAGIANPADDSAPYLRPAVDLALVTDDLNHQPRSTERPAMTRPHFLRRAALLGAKPSDGYAMWLDDPYGRWSRHDWPKDDPRRLGRDRIVMTVPRDSVWARALRLRNLRTEPIRLDVLVDLAGNNDGRALENKIEWRVVGRIAPQWAPIVLLRRPHVVVPPHQDAWLWMTIDTRGLKSGTYRGAVRLTATGLADRRVSIEIHVAPISIAPERPILFDAWHGPHAGLVYRQDYMDHGVNVSTTAFMTRAERQRWGYRMVKYNLGEIHGDGDEKILASHRSLVERMRIEQVGFDEAIWRIGDEPSGLAEGFALLGRRAREQFSGSPVAFNPGVRAGLDTFKALDPHTAIWWPYAGHFRFPNRVAVFSAKPYLWYSIHRGLSGGAPTSIYDELRSVPARPGHCLGMGIYGVNVVKRDPWDTAYQMSPGHEGVFIYPTRHGPVPTRGWEAIRDGGQHANLATMLKDRAGAHSEGDRYADLVASGSVRQLISALRDLEVAARKKGGGGEPPPD